MIISIRIHLLQSEAKGLLKCIPHCANAKTIVANYQPDCHMNIFPVQHDRYNTNLLDQSERNADGAKIKIPLVSYAEYKKLLK
jgi:hypothetical protein